MAARKSFAVDMPTGNSPLGTYAAMGAFIASLLVVVVALLIHFLNAAGIAPRTDTFIDNLAILGFGILVGTVGMRQEAVIQAAAKINGLQHEVDAAHIRLDKQNAPQAGSADKIVTTTTVVAPVPTAVAPTPELPPDDPEHALKG